MLIAVILIIIGIKSCNLFDFSGDPETTAIETETTESETAAPIEMAKPYLSRQVYAGMVKYLAGDLAFTSNAPKFVEIISWEKEGRTFFAAINEQEESPVAPMYEITVTVPGRIRGAKLIPAVDDPVLQAEQSTDLAVTYDEKADASTIALPKLEVFEIFEVIR